MASLVFFKFLAFLALIFAAVGYSQPDAKNITLGSRLYPQNTTSWLSPSGVFAFGFYKKADGFAVGIWMQAATPDPLVTWTANRDDPPIPPDAYLEFTTKGRLLLFTKQSVSYVYNLTEAATSVSLLDSGNLVAYNGSKVLWQSFDHPTDTILGGQFVQMSYTFYSSESIYDHSRGRFRLDLQPDGNLVAYPANATTVPAYAYWDTGTQKNGNTQLVLTENGDLQLTFTTDVPVLIAGISYNRSTNNTIYRATFEADGNFRLYQHIIDSRGNSTIVWSALKNQCEAKGYCGVNSYCSFNASSVDDKCLCFPGFFYFDQERKFLGCYSNFTYERFCGRDETSQLSNMSIGGNSYDGMAATNKEECGDYCMNDCNCWAALYTGGHCSKYKLPLLYATTQGVNQTGIALIRLVHDIFQSADTDGLFHQKDTKAGKRKREIILILAPPFGFLAALFTVLAVLSFFLYRRRALEYQKLINMENLGLKKEFTLRSFSYSELEKATDGFRRVIGNVSYGKIYEGIISEGNRRVSVNRLEKLDDEGEREFMAEITTMGRIHHKNVVQLVGFCLEGAKKLLVYEFMTNRSLVDVLYDVHERPFWKQRMRLALDIAGGIRYLHEECEPRVVHCKIRPKNILVDDNFTAKLSNFGSAKLLMPSQTEKLALDKERRGYSAPEWRKNELVSEKADVYSYGVVLLEIICCTGDEEINIQSSNGETFSTRVYRHFKAKQLRKLIGDEEVDAASLERFVKVGLCCIQDDSDLRPSMKSVILMLGGTLDTPIPLPPTVSQVNVSPDPQRESVS